MTAFENLIAASPRAFRAERAAEAVSRLGASGPLADLVSGAAGSSPYLHSSVMKEADWLGSVVTAPPDEVFRGVLSEAEQADGLKDVAAALRLMKRRAALWIALCDLGGIWELAQVTGALSDLADHAVELAFRAAFAAETSGALAGMTPQDAGLVVLAMGKGGARELNYSSDIDLILLHDDSGWEEDAAMEARPRWTRVAQRAVKLLSEVDANGYVFRVDLRLRPNPSVTPICLSVDAAERYYESMGRTWERAAFIKARAAAGNIAAGDAFLKDISPFVWRRSLDFAALEDINDIRAKIRDAKGLNGLKDLPGYNLKLGPGGIREIEFFAQTQQLAFGGRDQGLRGRTTLGILAALRERQKIDAETEAALADAYTAHRRLEHRFQMIDDAQTHDMPLSEEARDQVAALGGWSDRVTMEAEVAARLQDVRARVQGFFGRQGKDVVPTAEKAFADLPFARPELVQEMADRWIDGRVAATRTDRARRKFRALAPVILQKLSEASDPDEAAIQFDRFITGLPAGVQVFSLFEANPQLLDLIAEICTAAPRLAEYLGRNPAVLDAVLDRSFFSYLPLAEDMTAELTAALDGVDDYELALDTTRRWAKDQWFRIGVHILRGLVDAGVAGLAYTAVAKACVQKLMPVVEQEFARRHGPPPGRGAAVIGMGKLGSGELTATSDLDLIIVYDGADADASDGEKPLTIGVYYARLTKMLLSALTAQTAEGALYEVDMRLRPSGGQGPVAVSLESFRNYQKTEAWTWEHMALTRASVIAGEATLQADISATIDSVIAAPRDPAKTAADVAEMRAKLQEAHKAVRDDIWALKRGDGCMMDIEFVAQQVVLCTSTPCQHNTVRVLSTLAKAGHLKAQDADGLIAAYRLQNLMQQVKRVAFVGEFKAEAAGVGLKAVMARVAGEADFQALEARMAKLRSDAAAIVDRLIGG